MTQLQNSEDTVTRSPMTETVTRTGATCDHTIHTTGETTGHSIPTRELGPPQGVPSQLSSESVLGSLQRKLVATFLMIWLFLRLRGIISTAMSETVRWAHAQPILALGINAVRGNSLMAKMTIQDYLLSLVFITGAVYLLPISYLTRMIW